MYQLVLTRSDLLQQPSGYHRGNTIFTVYYTPERIPTKSLTTPYGISQCNFLTLAYVIQTSAMVTLKAEILISNTEVDLYVLTTTFHLLNRPPFLEQCDRMFAA